MDDVKQSLFNVQIQFGRDGHTKKRENRMAFGIMDDVKHPSLMSKFNLDVMDIRRSERTEWHSE